MGKDEGVHTRQDAMDILEERMRNFPVTPCPTMWAKNALQPVIVRPSQKGKRAE